MPLMAVHNLASLSTLFDVGVLVPPLRPSSVMGQAFNITFLQVGRDLLEQWGHTLGLVE